MLTDHTRWQIYVLWLNYVKKNGQERRLFIILYKSYKIYIYNKIIDKQKITMLKYKSNKKLIVEHVWTTILYIWSTQISVRTQIGVHSSNLHSLMPLSEITIRFKGILKLACFPNSQIQGWFIAIKSTSFSERNSVCAFTLSHDGCGSNLYIICIAYYNISNECKTSKFQA